MRCCPEFVDFGNAAESFFNGGRNHQESPWVSFTRDFLVALQEIQMITAMAQQQMLAQAAFQQMYRANYAPYLVLSGDDIYNGGGIDHGPDIHNGDNNHNRLPEQVNRQADIGPCPPGYDAGKWNNPNHNTPKYDVSRNFAPLMDELRAIPDEEGRKRFAENFLRSQIPVIERDGGKVLEIRNEKIKLDMGDGEHWIDTVRDIGGEAGLQWLPV